MSLPDKRLLHGIIYLFTHFITSFSLFKILSFFFLVIYHALRLKVIIPSTKIVMVRPLHVLFGVSVLFQGF